MNKAKEPEIIDTTDTSLLALVNRVPNKDQRSRLSLYFKNRDFIQEQTFLGIQTEIRALYELLCALPQDEPAIVANINLKMKMLKEYSAVTRLWLKLEAPQAIKKEFDELRDWLDKLLGILRKELKRATYDRIMDLWDHATGGKIGKFFKQ